MPATRIAMACGAVATMLAAALMAAPSASASSHHPGTVDPTDPVLVPNPIETSDPGTTWACEFVGPEVRCSGEFSEPWDLQEGPPDWCSAPLYSVHGSFSRIQTRRYQYDAASGQYLEYGRLIHFDITENLTPDADPQSSNIVYARLSMTWLTDFGVPGDLDSRVTRKQGIDTFMKAPDGGLILLDVGQKTTVQGDDFDFHGRWDIALGDPAVEFGKVCTALGL